MPWMVFDVESIGLHGEGYAVAWVVVDSTGREFEARREACPPAEATGTETGRAWVRDHCPALPITRPNPQEVRREFWTAWLRWKDQGAALIADCGWPVEARFLAACVDDARPAVRGGRSVPESSREFTGPYPLHELASLLVGAKQDRWKKFARLPDELPEHDPLADVRLTVRQLLEVLRRT
ncbi:hypothetical protein [Frigoriglobus tundricola]|uniref:Uncharacterized protein n=1 Tax=Frigoriglobus tundricola TaxID=2774151 RepID=A0A6M5YND0_9BACT|nr:hypothetical protein [Frigoriglobus tundricola]QJW94472.1 hypothetical protein FTUN_1992 [Frigoriglobus tundricola]